ncbi:MAG TPA: glycosyltransferase family 87 protein [Candidatus Limnocylindria bacterium]
MHDGRRADIAYLVGLAVGIAGLIVFFLDLRIAVLGFDDFSLIWSGPRAFLTGHDPYDPATWRDTQVGIVRGLPPSQAVYLYPPWVTIALVPFALLSARVAVVVWTLIGMLAAVVAMRALLRKYLPSIDWAHGVVGLLLMFSAPAAVTFLIGQWTFLFVAALIGMVLCLSSGRPAAAGLLAVVMLVKPPLFVFTAAALAVRALWPRPIEPLTGRRFVVVATTAGIATIAISWLVIPSWWPAWFEYVVAVQIGIEPVTIQTLSIQLFGPNSGWFAAPVILAMVFVALQFDPRSDGWLPVWFTLSSAGAIYSNTYDLLLLLIPIVIAAGALASQKRAALLILAGFVLMFLVMWYLHTIYVRGYAAGVALGVFVIITVSLWPQRRQVTSMPEIAALRTSPTVP